MCTIGVPSLSKPTFINIERLLGLAFEDYLNELMLQKRELAIKMINTIMAYQLSL